MTDFAPVGGGHMHRVLAMRTDTVMTTRTWTCGRAVIHYRTDTESDRSAMAGIAWRGRRQVIDRFAARDHVVMAAGALLGRAFKYAADMAVLANHELVLPTQREPGGEMIECEPLIGKRCGLRSDDAKQSGGNRQADTPS